VGRRCVSLLRIAHSPPKPLLRAYETFLLAGTLLAPHDVTLELAARLKSKSLQLLGERNRLLENRSLAHRLASRRLDRVATI
jgi:hypothetical protein